MQAIIQTIILASLFISSLNAHQIRLTFLHFNDFYEINEIDQIGGAAMLMTALKDARKKSDYSFTIVSGDFLSPSLISEFSKGSHIIKLFNEMKVDMVTLGNHEFDFGLSILKKRMGESSFIWLNSNILDSNKQPFAGTKQTYIKEVDGIKIGFAGLLTPRTSKLSNNVKSLTFISPLKSAKEAISKLKAEGADIIVLVTHLTIQQDLMLAKKAKGINLILGGHDHIPITYFEHGVLIQKSGTNGNYLGIVNLDIEIDSDSAGNKKIRVIPSWCMEPIYQLPPDPEASKAVSLYNKMLDEELNVNIAKTTIELDSKRSIVRGQESSIGDLIADALKEQNQADIALINGGSIRGDRIYPAGTSITLKDIYMELPFDNVGVVINIKGEDLLLALEHGFSAIPRLDGRFPQISGMTVVYNPLRPAYQRIENVKIGNDNLDKNKIYRLATTDFLLDGGDGYEMLKKAQIIVSPQFGQLVINSVMNYLQQHPEIHAIVGQRIRDNTEEGTTDKKQPKI